MGSCSDSGDALLPNSRMSVSSARLAVYTDVNVIPKRENHELEEAISDLEGEITRLKKKRRKLDERRREVLNNITNLKCGTIQVFCRVRPFPQPSKRKTCNPVETEPGKVIISLPGGGAKEFEFDNVFSPETTQEDVFTEVEPILRCALDGHNVCVLAYGQTGTGKTFTMDGIDDRPGIVVRSLEKLFELYDHDKSSNLTFSMSMLEVYMGNLRDLLAKKLNRTTHENAGRCNLNIRTDEKGHIEIDGLTEVGIPDLPKAKWWYNKGRRARSISWTKVNENSSRSHCLTRISVVRRWECDGKVESSKLWMVDLGGSERLLKSGATGLTLDEGRAINLSLSALGDVIAALRRKKGHVPYRNSKLTQILKDSLGNEPVDACAKFASAEIPDVMLLNQKLAITGDNSKAMMLVHVSPRVEDLAESLCSLSFAKRARAVKCDREKSEELKQQREKKLLELEETMRETEEECQVVGTQLSKAEFMLSEIKKLLLASQGPPEYQTEPITTPSDKQSAQSPKVSAKSQKTNLRPSSMPRFMNSTVASRQRRIVTERQMAKRLKSHGTETKHSVQYSGSSAPESLPPGNEKETVVARDEDPPERES